MGKFQELQDKWMRLSKRERWMVFGAGLIGVLGVMDTFMLEPMRQQINQAQAQKVKFEEDVAKSKQQVTKLKASNGGVNGLQQAEINDIQDKLKQQQAAMLDTTALMVKSTEILPLLKTVLKKHDDVEVVNLESLPLEDFIQKHVSKADPAAPVGLNPSALNDGLAKIYQHTFKLTVRGNYLSVMNYAYDLKKHAGVLSWESAEMKAVYPKTELTIHLYTLSMQNSWLGI